MTRSAADCGAMLLVLAQSLASPTTAQLADVGEDPETLNAMVRYTMQFDMTGSPTITLPCGFTDAGTPIWAFQFVGRHLEEEMLVRAGHAYQTAKDWHRQHPGHPQFRRCRMPPHMPPKRAGCH